MLVHCEAALHRRDSGDSDAVQRWSSTEGRRSVTRAQLTLHWCSPHPNVICHANGIRHAVAARIIVAMRHEPSATRSQVSKAQKRAQQAQQRAQQARTAAGTAASAVREREHDMCAPVRSGALLPQPAAIRVSSRLRGVEWGNVSGTAARDGRARWPREPAAHDGRAPCIYCTPAPSPRHEAALSLKQLPACRRLFALRRDDDDDDDDETEFNGCGPHEQSFRSLFEKSRYSELNSKQKHLCIPQPENPRSLQS